MKMEVRCCCDARLLGYLEVADSVLAQRGHMLRLHVPYDFKEIVLEFANVMDTVQISDEMYQAASTEPKAKEFIAQIYSDSTRLALKANHASIDDLRSIPGFESIE